MYKVTENPSKNRERSNKVLLVTVSLFVTLYLTSNIMAVKVIDLMGVFYFDAGTITFPFAYMLGDVLTEIWGFRTSKRVIWMTFGCNIILMACTLIGVLLPSPAYLNDTALAYNHIFNYVPRIVAGSLVGFLLGELSNAWIMERIKLKMQGRHLWVRTIGSSIVGYLFDTVPFVLIAFMGTISTHDLVMMLLFQYFSKLAIEGVLGTPMAYAAVAAIKRYINK